MYVEHTIAVMVDEIVGEYAHETGQHHQCRLIAVDQGHQGPVECLPVRVIPVIQQVRGNTGGLCALQSPGIRAVTDHGTDFRIDLSVLNGIHDGLQVGARSGYEHNNG